MLDSKRSVILITGASRGIGREIAISVASKISEDSTIVIVARNSNGLSETKEAIQRVKNVNVEVYEADLSSSNTNYADELASIVSKNSNNAQLVAIFHNAGTVGNLNLRSDELNSKEDWSNYLQTNLISTILINNAIYGQLKERVAQKSVEFLVVDTTSLLAIKAFPSFTQYSVAKASREAFFRSFALENPRTRVLSYSPGPVNTDMRSEVANSSYSNEIRAAFTDDGSSDVSRSVLTPKQTVDRLLSILHKNEFESGTRIDYFDD